MFRFAPLLALGFFAAAFVASPAQAREIPPTTLSPNAPCWIGEAYGEPRLLCSEGGRTYHCRVARTECWLLIPPGPYSRGTGGQWIAGATAQRATNAAPAR